MFCKKVVKDFTFFFEASDKFIIVKNWWYKGIFFYFLPFKRVFNRVQYHLELMDGSDNFFKIYL